MKVFIVTFGCQANEADSEKLAAALEKQGYQLIDNIQDADLVIINSCSVRETAENRVFGLVKNLGKKKIILTGCMVGSALGERRRYTIAQLRQRLPTNVEFKTIADLIGKIKVEPKRSHKTLAYVPIMEGCNHFCSYCVVPYARGKEASRPLKEIIEEVHCLEKQGYREILLLGQNVNSYQPGFAKLLRQLHQIKGLQKISFMTANPWDLSDEIIESLTLPKVDRYLHLPVQSGDDQILKKMNRPYTARQYLDLVHKIRRQIPDIQIGTDIIVGFPGETEAAFKNTVKMCQKIGFVKAYIAKYSPRSGTAAFKLKDKVPPAEKKRRWQALEKLINRK
jgi:tRNA-2-methylthio-N6-dimethylallyladenosine synthase